MPDVITSRARKTLDRAQDFLLGYGHAVRRPGRSMVRIWGFLLPVLILVLHMLHSPWHESARPILLWVAAYLAYAVSLEIARQRVGQWYDEGIFPAARVLINLGMITWLLAVAGDMRLVLWPFYLIPILATILYFSDWRWTALMIASIAIILFALDLQWSPEPALSWAYLTVVVVVLSIVSIQLHWGFRVALLLEHTASLSHDLHNVKTLSGLLQRLADEALKLADAQRSLVIALDPRTGIVIGHALRNLALQPGCNIQSLAAECKVLTHETPFHSHNLNRKVGDRSLYWRYFGRRVRYIACWPIHDRSGRAIGAVSALQDRPFAPGTDLLGDVFIRLLADLAGSALDGHIRRERAQAAEDILSEATARLEATDNADEVGELLLEYATRLTPAAQRLVLLRAVPDAPGLFPWKSSGRVLEVPDDTLQMLVSVFARQSPLMRNVISVDQLSRHSWFSECSSSLPPLSLLAAPLLSDDGARDLLGAIVLFSCTPAAFDGSDERNMCTLCRQAAAAFAKLGLAQAAARSVLLEDILSDVSGFALAKGENHIFARVVETACRRFGFSMARLRVLDPDAGELITVSTKGLAPDDAARLEGHRAPWHDFLELLSPRYRRGRCYFIAAEDSIWDRVPPGHFFSDADDRYPESWPLGCALLAPLETTSVIGLLSLDKPEGGYPPADHVFDAIGVFASASAHAIERARDVARLRRFLTSVSNDLARSRDPGTIGDLAVSAGSQLIGAEGACLYTVHDDRIELTHSSHLEATLFIGRQKPISDDRGAGFAAYVAATGKSLRLCDSNYGRNEAWAREVEHLKYLASGRSRNTLAVPVKSTAGRVVGVLHLENKTGSQAEQGFDDSDQEALEFLAQQVAIAWEHAEVAQRLGDLQGIGLEDDLHELVNWYHSGVVLWLDGAVERLARGQPDWAIEQLPGILDRARTTVNDLKSIHTAVASRYLDATTLHQALDNLASAWAARASLSRPIELHINGVPNRLPPRVQYAIMRIMSNAVGNATLHSGVASQDNGRIWVRVELQGAFLELEVGDNGRGAPAGFPEGFGIARVRAIAKQLGWRVSIDNTPHQGFKVKVAGFVPDEDQA